MTRITILGAAGRMGRQIVADALRDSTLQVVGAVDTPDAPHIGEDIASLCDHSPTGVFVQTDLDAALEPADVVIDFSVAAGTLKSLPVVCRHRKAYVIGTTGFDEEGRSAIHHAAADIPVLLSPNMSVGINLLASVLPTVVRVIDGGYDIEVLEAHHRFKRDAPSGTAMWLTDIIEQAREEVQSSRVYGRHGLAARATNEIGLHAIRAGGNPGEHSLIFANEGEQIELTHRVFNRQTYALGALRAAKYLADKPAGFYTMLDVLAESSWS